MKKVLFICLCLILLTSCDVNTNKKIVQKKEEIHMEMKDEAMMTFTEINEYNQYMMEHTKALYDLESMTELSKEEILSMIQKYQLPDSPYNDGILITQDDRYQIINNLNLDKVTSITEMKKGIIINKTNLKSFPTHISFHSSLESTFDMIQESELAVNSKVLILHESKDHKWNFVISNIYAGWVLKEDIAEVNDYNEFDSDRFVVITTPFLEVDGTLLTMGVRLPYFGHRDGRYEVYLPTSQDGYLKTKRVFIDEKYLNVGYLPYTKENLVKQAFKYEGVKYRWGGKGYGVDCSSFVSNVYLTFGIQLARNTGDQEESLKDVQMIGTLSNQEKLNQLKEHEFALMYQPGHVMLYLGYENGTHKMIHANARTMDVAIEEITPWTSNLYKIDRFAQIK